MKKIRFTTVALAVFATGMTGILGGCAGTGGTGAAMQDSVSWKFVDGDGANGLNYNVRRDSYFPRFTAYNSKLYVAWREEGEDLTLQIRVAVYSGNDHAPSWKFVDGNGATGINHNAAMNAYNPSLIVFDDKLYAVWHENNGTSDQIRVAVYNGRDDAPSWAFVDGNGSNGINRDASKPAKNVAMAVLGSQLYATWHEQLEGIEHIRVAAYNGNDNAPTWTFVDSPGMKGMNYDNTFDAFEPSLTVFKSKLYAVWREFNGEAYQVRMAIYNGQDDAPFWEFVTGRGSNGANYDSTRDAVSPRLEVSEGKLYAIWQESAGEVEQIRAAVYNGNDRAPSWAFVAGDKTKGMNRDAGKSAYAPQLISFGSGLHAAWYESDGNTDQIYVAAYNGNDNAPAWRFVNGAGSAGLNHDKADNAFDPYMIVFDSKLYVAWKEMNDLHGQLRIATGQ